MRQVVWLDDENGDNPVNASQGNPLPTQRNRQVVALASARDTAGGRTSEALVNASGRGIAVLIDVTEVRGTAMIGGVFVDVQVGTHWLQLAQAITLSIDTVGGYGLLFCPGDSVDTAPSVTWTRHVKTYVPRNYRIRITGTMDDQGNDMTYQVSVVEIP